MSSALSVSNSVTVHLSPWVSTIHCWLFPAKHLYSILNQVEERYEAVSCHLFFQDANWFHSTHSNIEVTGLYSWLWSSCEAPQLFCGLLKLHMKTTEGSCKLQSRHSGQQNEKAKCSYYYVTIKPSFAPNICAIGQYIAFCFPQIILLEYLQLHFTLWEILLKYCLVL